MSSSETPTPSVTPGYRGPDVIPAVVLLCCFNEAYRQTFEPFAAAIRPSAMEET
jgi:hypothetical protein